MIRSKQIISSLKEHLGIKKDTDFAKFLGIEPNTLANWKSRNSVDIELILTKCEGISPLWLLKGEGDMFFNGKNFGRNDKFNSNLSIVQKNYSKAVRLIILEQNLKTETDFTKWFGITIEEFKLINNGMAPSLEQVIMLCGKCNFNANWILMEIGEPMINEEHDLHNLVNQVNELKSKIDNFKKDIRNL